MTHLSVGKLSLREGILYNASAGAARKLSFFKCVILFPAEGDVVVIAEEAARSPIAAWESFYVIVGSSAAALTGLQFVVIALVAEMEGRASRPEIRAFGTPTIVHFSAVLLISAILSAPWQTLSGPAFSFAACGLAGIALPAVVGNPAPPPDRVHRGNGR